MGCEAKPLNDDGGGGCCCKPEPMIQKIKLKRCYGGISHSGCSDAVQWSTLMRSDGRRFDCLNTAQRLH